MYLDASNHSGLRRLLWYHQISQIRPPFGESGEVTVEVRLFYNPLAPP
jgi:hypothetical protein